MKRLVVAVVVALLLAPSVLAGQRRIAGFIEPMPTAKLKQLFPRAVAFTPRGEKDPLYFTAYAADPATTPNARPVGWAFWSMEAPSGSATSRTPF